MPVDMTGHGRFGRHGTLGDTSLWICPGCGVQNEGRKPEQGCVHCGAGDPSLSKAGTSTETRTVHYDSQAEKETRPHPGQAEPVRPVLPTPVQATRIVRLIEYLIQPGQEGVVLRNSLVGTMTFAWGQLTGTIVDSVDTNQEDRLRLAKLQPGVWLGNPEAMALQDAHARIAVQPLLDRQATWLSRPEFAPLVRYGDTPGREESTLARPFVGRSSMEPPDTGPAWSALQGEMAKAIHQLCGDRVTHTLSLALSSIAEELGANSEPEKFLSREDCLALANALLNQIPAEWQGDQEVPPDGPEF